MPSFQQMRLSFQILAMLLPSVSFGGANTHPYRIVEVLPSGKIKEYDWKSSIEFDQVTQEQVINMITGDNENIKLVKNNYPVHESSKTGLIKIPLSEIEDKETLNWSRVDSKEQSYIIIFKRSSDTQIIVSQNCQNLGINDFLIKNSKELNKNLNEAPLNSKDIIVAECNPWLGTTTLDSSYTPKYRASPLGHSPIKLGLGLGNSALFYSEPRRNLNITEWALTPKLDLRYSFQNYPVSLSANAFFGLVTFWHKSHSTFLTDSLTPFRSYGVNARVTYHFLKDPRHAISVGPYFWGMLVPQKLYGTQYVAGPQLYYQFRWSERLGLYLKYASVSETITPSISNAEFAVGTSLLWRRFKTIPTSITLDIARINFDSKTVSQGFTLFSSTLGVSIGL